MAKIIKLENKNKQHEKVITAHTKKAALESPVIYEKQIKQNPLDQKAYNRLMILYRKLKEYKKELHVINRAIRSFEAFHKSHKKKTGKVITTISNQLNKALGLVDHKGKAVYSSEPVAGWKRRKETVVRKISG